MNITLYIYTYYTIYIYIYKLTKNGVSIVVRQFTDIMKIVKYKLILGTPDKASVLNTKPLQIYIYKYENK